jgi:peptide subunit release factor RF-3
VNATGDWMASEAARRRTFAVISHPRAGKATHTEALAGAVLGISLTRSTLTRR